MNLKAVLYDGSYHPVDSSEIAFKTAAQLAYKAAMPEANPVLLEPIGELKVTVPESYTGDVMGDISKRRAGGDSKPALLSAVGSACADKHERASDTNMIIVVDVFRHEEIFIHGYLCMFSGHSNSLGCCPIYTGTCGGIFNILRTFSDTSKHR